MIVGRYAASAGIPLSPGPTPVASADDVDALLAAMKDPARRAAMVCVTMGDAGQPLLRQAVQLEKRLMGLAQVMVLAEDASSLLTGRIADEAGSAEAARQWGVFGGAVRLYWPGIELRGGNPFRHRTWVPHGEADHAALEDELFDVLAWASAQRDEPGWIDTAFVQRLEERDAIAAARGKARDDAEFYEEYCRRLEQEKERLEREKVALAEQRREAVERADDAERGRESLRYQFDLLVAQVEELRRRAPARAEPDAERYTVLRYCKGGQRERDCIAELDLADETRAYVEEQLAWLASPASWARSAGRLEQLRDGIHEFRVNVKDHWLRVLVARAPKFHAVLVLHAFAKKTNELPAAEVKTALERLRELAVP
jgi:phage-related protein